MSAEIPKVALTGEEKSMLEQILPLYLDVGNPSITGIVRSKVIEFVEGAKSDLKAVFGGPYAGANDLGIAAIRPHHVAGSVSWRKNYPSGSQGWTNWPDFTNVTLPKDQWVMIWEFENEIPVPRTSAILMTIGVTTLPVIDLRGVESMPRRRVPLPDPIILPPATSYSAEVRAESVGYDELRPIGIVIAKGRKLATKSYYT